MSRQPPDVSSAVTSFQDRIRIEAAIATVWDVILDFPSYPLWNSFVRSQAITDASYKPLLAHPTPTEGAPILMHTRIPPRGLADNDKGLRATKAVITVVDHANHRIAWREAGLPDWLLRAERWQELTEEQVDGRTFTTFMTVEVGPHLLAL